MNSIIELFKVLGIQFGSCELTYDEATGKKIPKIPNGWDCLFNQLNNCVYLKTGEVSDLVVLDLDNLKSPVCQKLKSLAEQCCNFSVRTSKGYHYYFKFNRELKKTRHVKGEFDYLADGSIVFAPPTKYKKEGKDVSYTAISIPAQGESLNHMSDELIEELNKYFIHNAKPHKDFTAVCKKEIKQVDKSKNTKFEKLSNDQMKIVLEKLHISRSNDYSFWMMCGLALKGDGYDFELWDNFSKRSDKYQDGETYYMWYKHLNTNQLTTSTLMYWLKTDSREEFNKLVIANKLKDCDTSLDLTNDKVFNNDTMVKYLKQDVEKLGDADYIANIENTRSFKYFNHFHLYCSDKNIYFKLEMEGQHTKLQVMSDIRESYLHYKISDKSKFVSQWKECENKQLYSNVNFHPKTEECPKSVFNTFTGFKYNTVNKDYDKEKIKPFITHLTRLLRHDQELVEYVLNYVAHIRQKPWKKTNVGIVLYSDTQGTGKNTLIEIFAKIFEGYYCQVNEDDLYNKFNAIFGSKLFIFGNEIRGNSKADIDKLNDMITRTTMNIEIKGKDKYQMEDHANYMFTTNHSAAIKTVRTCRRFLQVQCTEKLQTDGYYDKLYTAMKDDDCMTEFDKFLCYRDISKFKPSVFPMTELKLDSIVHSLPAYITMMRRNASQFAGGKFTFIQLYNISQEYAQKNKVSSNYTDRLMAKDMKRFFDQFRKRSHKNVSAYEFPENFADIVDGIIRKKCVEKDEVETEDDETKDDETETEPKVIVKVPKSKVVKKKQIKCNDFDD